MDTLSLVQILAALLTFVAPFLVINGIFARLMWMLGLRGGGTTDVAVSTFAVVFSLGATAALHLMTPLGTASAALLGS